MFLAPTTVFHAALRHATPARPAGGLLLEIREPFLAHHGAAGTRRVAERSQVRGGATSHGHATQRRSRGRNPAERRAHGVAHRFCSAAFFAAFAAIFFRRASCIFFTVCICFSVAMAFRCLSSGIEAGGVE